uniref:Uncharacterized protein n=1 Tax=Tetranychus urticae TaxID=32264 RepID=T1KQX2_TETUR
MAKDGEKYKQGLRIKLKLGGSPAFFWTVVAVASSTTTGILVNQR